MPIPDTLLTWENLATVGGLVTGVYWLTQFTKKLVDGWLSRWHMHLETQYLAWFWATLLALLVWAKQGAGDAWDLAILPVQAVFAAIIAMKTHETAAQDGLDNPRDRDIEIVPEEEVNPS